MDVVYALRTSHVTSSQGHTVLVIHGTHWPADDPIVRGHPDLFSRDPVVGLFFSRPPVEEVPLPSSPPEEPHKKPVETATRAPGERRPPRG